MNYFKYWFFSVAMAVILISCDSVNETDNPQTINTDTLPEVPRVSLAEYSDAFKNLVKTDQGIFRGVNLGMPLSEIKSQEDTSQLGESAEDHLDYMINIQDLETADIRYIANSGGQLSKIEVNIYPRSKGSQDSLYREFTKFFTAKYGESSTISPNSQKWENKKTDVIIFMEKKDTQKVHDINIIFSSLIGQSAFIFEETLPENQ